MGRMENDMGTKISEPDTAAGGGFAACCRYSNIINPFTAPRYEDAKELRPGPASTQAQGFLAVTA